MQQPTIYDNDIMLRPWRPQDAPQVYAACQDPLVQRYTRIPVPYSRANAHEFVAQFAVWQWRHHRGASFAVCDSATAEVLGACGLMEIDATNLTAEAGYWLAPGARGRGVARRALEQITAFAFDHMHLDRVELLIEPSNEASAHVAERAGYEREGLLRSKALLRGERLDMVLYARTRQSA